MKKQMLMMMLVVGTLLMTGCSSRKNMTVEAEVLSINCEILEGRLISHFLAGSSGFIRSDSIKVGVKFTIKNHLFLRDLKLNHSQLAYYRDKSTLPLGIEIEGAFGDGRYRMIIRLNGTLVDSLYLSKKLGKHLIKHDSELKEVIGML